MSEKSESLYPTLPKPETLVETAGEKPSVIPNPTEERPRKPYNEAEEIASNFSLFLFICLFLVCFVKLI